MSNNEKPAYERTKLVLEINHLTKKFAVDGGKFLTACNDINLRAYEGRTLGIIGESGCGKSTLVRTLLRIHPATSGEAIFEGHDLMQSKGEQLRQDRKNIQMVFQDPTAAFNPKMLVKDILTEPLKNFGLIKNSEVDAKAAELLEMVELPAEFKDRYPHSMSGGQRQRLGIARALALEPKIIVCDEATSALDPQTTKSILHLLQDINKKMNLTIVLITHQMEVVKTICDRVAVIESGDIIEEGPMIDVFTNPQHPTTKEFTKSVINAELPDIVKQMKLSDTYTEGSKLLVRISFIGDSASEPIISGMVKHFDVDVSIISGNTDQLKDVLFGTLLIEISGNRERIKNALEYLHQQHLKTEVIGYES